MKRRNFLQSIAALFGAAALPPAVGDGVALTSIAHPHIYEHVTYPSDETFTTHELTDEEYAALANRRTQALIESMRHTAANVLNAAFFAAAVRPGMQEEWKKFYNHLEGGAE